MYVCVCVLTVFSFYIILIIQHVIWLWSKRCSHMACLQHPSLCLSFLVPGSAGAIAAAGTTTLRGTSLGAAKKDKLCDRSAAMAAATITTESTRRAIFFGRRRLWDDWGLRFLCTFCRWAKVTRGFRERWLFIRIASHIFWETFPKKMRQLKSTSTQNFSTLLKINSRKPPKKIGG